MEPLGTFGKPCDAFRSPCDTLGRLGTPCAIESGIPCIYWMTQKLPQICTVILRFRIGKVERFAVSICGNF